MDDKEDPFSKSSTPKPPLPPFSSLRPHLPFAASGYSSSEQDSGYETYQQQKQLHFSSTYVQDNGSHHFHPHSSSADFSLHSLAGGLQNCHQPSPVNISSFSNSSKQVSHFHARDQSQFLNSLHQPPIPDISLSLPFSTGHEHMLGGSHVSGGTKSFSNGSLFPNNNPPLMSQSQIESFLSETEQNSLSDFNTLSQTMNDNDMISSWQTSYNSELTDSSHPLTSYSGLSSLMSMASGTWDNTHSIYLTSDLPSNSNKVTTFSQNQCVPESNYRFPPSTSSLSGCTSSHYQMSGSPYPGNTHLSNPGSMINHSDRPYAEFGRADSNYESKNQAFHVQSQNNQAGPRNKVCGAALNTLQKTSDVINEKVSAKGSKGRRKKKLAVDSLDTEVKTVMKKKKVKTSKKAGYKPTHEASLTDDDNESATFCLSPTFIASLSSKRASDSHLPTAQSDPYVRHQEGMHQRSHSVESAQSAGHKEYQVANNIPVYTAAAHESIETLSHRDGFLQTSASHQSNVQLFRRNDFPQTVHSCVATASVSNTNGMPQTFGSYHASGSVPNTNRIPQTLDAYPISASVSITNRTPQTLDAYPTSASVSNTNCIPQTLDAYRTSVSVSITNRVPQTLDAYPTLASVSNTNCIPQTLDAYRTSASVSNTNCIPQTLDAYRTSASVSNTNCIPQTLDAYPTTASVSITNRIPQTLDAYPTTASVSITNCIPQTLDAYPTTASVSITNGVAQLVGSYPSTAPVSSISGVLQSLSSYQSTVPLSLGGEFSQPFNSQISYASLCATPSALAQSVARSDKTQDCQLPIRPTYAVYTPNIKPGLKSNKNKFNESLKLDVEEDRSSSPFQLSPGFISSLSSKRAEEHPLHNLMKTSSAMDNTLDISNKPAPRVSCNSNYNFSRQLVQSSVSSLEDNMFVTYAQSKLQSSVLPTSYARQVLSPPAAHLLTRSHLPTSQNCSSHKYSGYQGNYETVPTQTLSPKPYVSPPAYSKGSKFQYPTPPMEDDEGRLQSPGPCLSPGFLDSLSRKVASSELTHRLTPIIDDNVSALPTPPNSAGPKQFYVPDMTLSKEEQTNRILEIIAREREKMSITSQISDVEPKKRKRKKKSKEIGNTSVGCKDSSIQLPEQMEQPAVPFDPEVSLHNKADAISVMYPLHNKPVQQAMMWSEDYADSFGSEQLDHKFTWEDSFGTVGDICSRNESLQSHSEEHSIAEFKNAVVSTKVCAMDLNKDSVEEMIKTRGHEGVKSLHQSPQSKYDLMNRPRTLLTEPCKSDPYAFDDSEQADLNTSLLRSLKPVVNLPYTDQVESHYVNPISHVPFIAHNKQSDPTFSDVPFETHKQFHSKQNQPVHPAFYHTGSNTPYSKHTRTAEKVQNTEPLPSASQQTVKESKRYTKGSQFNTGTMIIKSEPSNVFFNNEDSSSQIHRPTFNIKQQEENQERPNSVNNTLSPIKAPQRQKMHKNNSYFHAPQGLSSNSEANINTQVTNVEYVQEYSKPFPDASAGFSGLMSDTLINRVKVSLGTAKKKRGRPPKSMYSNLPLPVKSKVPKLKLYEQKAAAQTPTQMLYKLNGMEVKRSDLNVNQNLVDRLANNLMEVADCTCLGPDHIPSEATEGPYYTQLGAAKDIPGVRTILEQRTGLSGSAIRIEKVIYTGKEGKSKEGCPIAKWIIRRSGPGEKYLCIVRKRPGHFCDTAVIIMVIVAWEGVECHQADTLYDFLISTLPQNGLETDRRCGLNEKKTCACQGVDLLRRGASFSFGCSWSMYYNGCKFARSQMARKFKLKDPEFEDELEDQLQKLASDVAPLYSQLAPDAFRNQVQFESIAEDCRLGSQPGRPFSGVTAVVDFCCHSHRDCHNMNNGSTVVVNLTKHRGYAKPDDEQYHVLPLYILDQTDELGSMEGQNAKVRSGSLEILSHYVSQVRRRSTPYRPCKRNRTTPKKQGIKKSPKNSRLSRVTAFPRGHFSDETFQRHESNVCDSESVSQSSSVNKVNSVDDSKHPLDMVPGVGLEGRNQKNMTYMDLMSQQGMPGFGDLYMKFWDFFYTHGEFPPLEWTSKNSRSSNLPEAVKSTVKPSSLTQSSAADQMSLQQQQQQPPWQHQEQQNVHNHNINVRSEQQEKIRQHNLVTCFPGKQGFQSPSSSPFLPHIPASPRQQYHSHGYQCESSVLKAAQTSPTSSLPTSSDTLCPESFSHKSHYCISSSLSSSIPVTSSKHQQYFSQLLPFSGHSHTLSDTTNRKLFESSESITQPTCSSSVKSPTFSSITGASTNVALGVLGHLRPPPPYPDSVLNQYKFKGSTRENLCRLKPPIQSPSFDESLDQNTQNRIENCNDSQEHITESICSSSDFIDRTYLHEFNKSLKDLPDNVLVSLSEPERSSLSLEVQGSSLARTKLVPLGSRPASALSHHISVSPHLEYQSSHLHRPQSAQLSTISSSHSCKGQPLNSSISRNVFMQSMSCPATVQSPGDFKLAHSLNKQSCVPVTDEPHAVHTVKTHTSNLLVARSLSEDYSSRPPYTSRPPSAQLCERSQSSQVLVSQLEQGTHTLPSVHSNISHMHQLSTISESCSQTFSPRAHSVMEESRVEHNGSDSWTGLSSVSRRSESFMSDPPIFTPGDKQAKAGIQCWSRMSEPSKLTDTARPSSCFSEPDIVNGWKREHPSSLTAGHDLDNKPSLGTSAVYNRFDSSRSVISETRKRCDDIHETDLQETKHVAKHAVLYTEREPQSDCTTPSGIFKPYSSLHWFQGQEKEHGKSSSVSVNNSVHDDSIPLLASNSNPLQINGTEHPPNIATTPLTQCTNVDTHDEMNSGSCYMNRPVGSVCPNGPIIREKMKVHKSEGFVFPKANQSPSEPPYEVIDSTVVSVETDDNRQVFDDPAVGGVAIALCHGAVLFEVAKRELHATTALKEPNRYRPKRISLVFYQHKNLNLSKHGFDEYERKTEERRNQAEQTRLIEEMESKGFFKGELSELASFPSLTKGTFGKVFNFPEAKKSLFPLRFPRYLDCSHSEHITPVMFACMSIAFPNYMKEAFPDPSKLPRLMSDMPVRMHSSLSDKRKHLKVVNSNVNKQDLQLLVDNCDEYGGIFQKVFSPWSPKIPQESTVTTNTVLTRWVHDDVTVTGPYNRWVELALQDGIKKEETWFTPKVKSEDEQNIFESPPQHDQESSNSCSTICPGTFPHVESDVKTDHTNQDNYTVTTMVVNLDHSSPMNDLGHSHFSNRSSKMGIGTTEESASWPTVEKDPCIFSISTNESLEGSFCDNKCGQGLLNGMARPYVCLSEPTNASSGLERSGLTEDTKSELGSNTLLRNDIGVSESYKDQRMHNVQTEGPFPDDQQSKSLLKDHTCSSTISSPAVKSTTEDENLNCMEHSMVDECSCQITSKNTLPQYVPHNDPVAGNISVQNGKENCTSEMESECKGKSGNVSGKWESMYDFLMKGFHRPFMSSQQNSSHAVQDDQIQPSLALNALEDNT